MDAPSHTKPSGRPHRSRLRRAAPFAAIVAFLALLLYRLVLLGESLYWGDIFLYFLPVQQAVNEALRHGRLPLWNPYVLCGQPLVGNAQASVFYPTTLLAPFVPPWLFLTLNAFGHLAFAGLGTYLFLRRLTGDRLSAILGAVTFAGSGYLIARMQFPPMTQAAAYLPWLLLLVDRMVDRPRVWYCGLLGLVVGLELLAGHPQIAYLTYGSTVLYAAARVWHARRHPTRVRRALAGIAAAFSLGLLVGSAQVLPALQLFQVSTRERLTWMQANRFVFLPEQLIGFVVPSYYGSPAQADYWGAGNAWEPCVYVGLLPLLLAGYAVVRAGNRPAVRFFAVLGLVALWLAMGRFGGLFWLAFYVVPGLRSFHDPARFTFLTTFAISAVASMGLRALRDRSVPNGWRLALVVCAAANLWWSNSAINPTLSPLALYYRPRVLARTPRAGTGRVFTAEREQVWKRYLSYSDYGPDSNRYAHELADTLAPNVGMRFHVEEASGYEPVPVRAVTQVDGLVRSALARRAPNLPALLGCFNAKLLLLPQSTRYPHPALVPLHARGVTALGIEDSLPRAWLVRRTRIVAGERRTLAALSDPAFDPRLTAIVASAPEQGADGSVADLPAASVVQSRSAAGALRAVVDAGPAPGFLVWSSACYPGWEARVDGRPVPARRANHAFLGADLTAGRHAVDLTYRPQVVRVALYLTVAALGLIAVALAYGVAVRRHPSGRAHA